MCFHGKLFSEIITAISIIIYNFLEQWFGHIKSSLYQNIKFIFLLVEQKLWQFGWNSLFLFHFIFQTFNEFLFNYEIFYYKNVLHTESSGKALSYTSFFSFLTYLFLIHLYVFFWYVFHIFPVSTRISYLTLYG